MTEDALDFLKASSNSHQREAILRHHFVCEVLLAAAARGYCLKVYTSEVDHDGYDVVLDDDDWLRKLQLKSVHPTATTAKWNVHRDLLRPDLHFADRLGYAPGPDTVGTQGGVLLQDFSIDNGALRVSYRYTDIFVLTAFHESVIDRESAKLSERAGTVLEEVQQAPRHSKLSVPAALFVKLRGVHEVLAILGLHSIIHATPLPLAIAEVTSVPREQRAAAVRGAQNAFRRMLCTDSKILYPDP